MYPNTVKLCGKENYRLLTIDELAVNDENNNKELIQSFVGIQHEKAIKATRTAMGDSGNNRAFEYSYSMDPHRVQRDSNQQRGGFYFEFHCTDLDFAAGKGFFWFLYE